MTAVEATLRSDPLSILEEDQKLSFRRCWGILAEAGEAWTGTGLLRACERMKPQKTMIVGRPCDGSKL